MDLISNDIPFVYRERQLQSIFAPILNEISGGCYKVEVFVSRNKRKPRTVEKEVHGWVDYWCGFRNTDIFIELKHGFVSEKTGRVRQDVQNKWDEALIQISSIKDDIMDYSLIGTNGAKRIVLIVLPIYQKLSESTVAKASLTELLTNIQVDIMNNLFPSPNWSGLWILHDKLENQMEYLYSSESYSGVLFMAYVE